MGHVYLIAEAGVNHNGDRDRAFELIDAAADAGADAVKFQTFDATKLASASLAKAEYQKSAVEESQREMLGRLELPWEWHVDLKRHAIAKGVAFMSTAFDIDSLDNLVRLGVPMIKVPSGELTNAPLVWRYANAGLPLIISTGMASLAEVELALAVVTHAVTEQCEPAGLSEVWHCWASHERRSHLSNRVTLLHCTTQYPAAYDEVNLAAMDTLRSAFGLPVGYSDHTLGTVASIAAAARGATVIEKHFTLDRTLPGPDHAASLEPTELKALVQEVRAVERMVGDGIKAPQPSEWGSRDAGRQQIVAARDIAVNQVIARDDLTTARCGDGLLPTELWDLVGSTARSETAAGNIFRR